MSATSLGPFAAAAAVAFVGALVVDVPLGLLAVFAVALACLLMMVFMMKGMHGSEGSRSEHRDSGRLRDPHSHH